MKNLSTKGLDDTIRETEQHVRIVGYININKYVLN